MKPYVVRATLLLILFAIVGVVALLVPLLTEVRGPASAAAQGQATSPTSADAPAPTCVPGNSDYVVAVSQDSLVPGTNMIPGSHCNNCTNAIDLPFSFALYDRKFTTAIVGSNGVLGFLINSNPGTPNCLPAGAFDYAIFPDWEQMTYRYSRDSSEEPSDNGDTPAFAFGVFTSVTGVAPNRIFNIEWRANDYFNVSPINMEVRLYENSRNRQFDVVYAQVNHHGGHATVGVQKGTGSQYTQFSCLTQGRVGPGVKLTFTLQTCIVAPPPISY